MGMMDKFQWTERQPAPLNLSDREILDWMNENCDQVVYTRPTANTVGGFTLFCYDQKTTKKTLREAVCLAAAKWAEANGVKFAKTFCSQCGGEFGPGDHGFSHCEDHQTLRRIS